MTSATARSAALLACAWLSLPACSHPPAPSAPAPSAGGPSGGPREGDCAPVAPGAGLEGCADDAARPASFAAVERAGEDRDGDGVEDLLDRCVDEPEDTDGDRDDDGCPDPDETREDLLAPAD